jgi:Cadherin domain
LVNSMPYFDRPAYAFAVPENQPRGTSVGRVTASVDPPSSGCRFSIDSDGRGSSLYMIDPYSGVITTSGPVTRSSDASDQHHVILLGATNADRPQATTHVNATIFVVSGGVDVSGSGASVYFQYPPAGGDNVVRVATDAPMNFFVVQLSAVSRSPTSSGRLTYSFVDGNGGSRFAVDPRTGVIRTAVSGDRLGNSGTVYSLAIAASLDDGGGSAVAVLVVVIVPRAATVSTTPAAAEIRSGSSTESTWWTDNGKVVIATSACVSAAVVIAVVVIVVCVVCRLRNANKDFEKRQSAQGRLLPLTPQLARDRTPKTDCQ